MKKLLSVLLVCFMIFTLAACGNKEVNVEITTQQGEEKTEKQEKEEVKSVERLSPEGGSITIGDKTITAEYLPFETPFFAEKFTNPAMGVYGDKIYVGDGINTIKVYTYDGAALTYEKTLNIENETQIEFDKDGFFYTKGGVFEAKKYDGEGTQIGEAAASGEISVSETSDFALTYFPGRDEITKISGGVSEPWVIKGLNDPEPQGPFKSSIYEIEIVGEHVLVTGKGKNDMKTLAVFDLAGNQLAVTNDSLAGNNTNAIAETANGYIATAVNRITLIAKDGTITGTSSNEKELFGADEVVWIEQMHTEQDGSVLAFASVSREDGSRDFVMFKLTGF